jgi:hypothetical protein
VQFMMVCARCELAFLGAAGIQPVGMLRSNSCCDQICGQARQAPYSVSSVALCARTHSQQLKAFRGVSLVNCSLQSALPMASRVPEQTNSKCLQISLLD